MCVFCQIANKEIPAEIVRESKGIIVFKNIKPKAPVHLLIVPKKHIGSIEELDEADKDIVGEMFLTAKELARENKLAEGGYQLLVNGGVFQVVPHLHLHLIGGKLIED